MYYKRLLESSVFHHSADYCKWEQNLDKACAVWAGHLLVFFFFYAQTERKVRHTDYYIVIFRCVEVGTAVCQEYKQISATRSAHCCAK